jgi:hypothetical protein
VTDFFTAVVKQSMVENAKYISQIVKIASGIIKSNRFLFLCCRMKNEGSRLISGKGKKNFPGRVYYSKGLYSLHFQSEGRVVEWGQFILHGVCRRAFVRFATPFASYFLKSAHP